MREKKYIINRNTFFEFGKAINYCIRENISIKGIQLIHKSKKIEEVCGLRKGGIPFQFAWELDYHCPICGTEPIQLDLNEDEFELLHITFSEYNYFMYCYRCNLDIPSFLCLKANSRKAIQIYTERYLKMIESIKSNIVEVNNE